MYLIDTNVMLAASALTDLSAVAGKAMPLEIELREMAFNWIEAFERSDQKIVLDEEGLIRDEYDGNLPFNFREQEYAMQVLQSKLDRGQVEYVPVVVDEGGGDRVAVLSASHEALVPDRADRKWVACALATQILFDRAAPIVYAAERDWYIAEAALRDIGIDFVRLLPDSWYQTSHRNP